MRNKLFWIAALLALALPAATASAAPHGHGGGGWGGGGWHGGHGHVVIGGGYWGWGWPYYGYYGYPYGYGYGGYYGGSYGGGNGYGESWGAVKTDVDPEEARVYLDGQYIGTADDFDGWPDKLYLKPGNYKLEFRLHGYEPLTLNVRSRPGATLEVENKLHRLEKNAQSEADPPKLEGDVPRYFGKRRDRDRAQAWSEEQDRGDDSYARHPDDRYSEGDRDADHDRPAHSDEGWRRQRAPDSTVTTRPVRADRARLTIHAGPSDAAVYVDDRFVGTADELASMDHGIVVAPGKHTVTVSRPGYRDRSTQIEVAAGKSETVTLALEK
jgi:hypothetical protein